MGVVTLGSNISALIASRRLSATSESLSTSLQRLSSGKRINRASDDAAGLAISSGLQLNSRVYSQAIRNGNDAISALNISQGAVQELSSVVMRLQELAIQAASGTFSSSQRGSLDTEGLSLTDEFNRIVGSTNFNGLQLTRGDLGTLGIQLGFGTNGQIGVGFGSGLSRNVGNGFSGSTSFSTGGTATSNQIADADFNHDGKLDLVSVTATGISISLGNGDGTFQAAVGVNGIAGSTSIAIGDFNGDGNIDVASGGAAGGGIYLGNADGTFQNGVAYGAGNISTALRVGDFNGDGITDLIGGNGTTLRIFQGQGDGQFAAGATLTLSNGATSDFQVGDLNNDGIDDVVASAGISGINYFLSVGGGAFGSRQLFAVGGSVSRIVLADFNGDGNLDIGASLTPGNNFVTRLSNGDGTYASATNYTGFGGAQVKAVDVNGDGIKDIVGVKANTILLLLGKGDGTFNSAVTYTSTGATTNGGLLVDDFNGDGAVDVICNSSVAGTANEFFGLSAVTTTIQRLNLRTRANALNALSVLDDAFNRINKELGNIGASQSRLASALNTLADLRDNSNAAASRITDIDIAHESSERVRLQILQQATVGILAHARQQPALVLTLLQ